MREAKQTHSTAVMDIAQPAPVRTISRDAFALVLNAIRSARVTHFPIAAAEGPALIVEGSPDALERVRVIAEDVAHLYVHLSFTGTWPDVSAELKVFGFDRELPQVRAGVPNGHQSCDHCPGYGPLYESLPVCRDCGDAVCESCRLAGSLTESDGESKATCLCKSCWHGVVVADYEADGDLDVAHAHAEES